MKNFIEHVIGLLQPADEAVERTVVRLKTSWWRSPRGMHQRRDITFLTRKCEGFSPLREDLDNVNPNEILIENLNDCQDGVYQVLLIPDRYDYMSGELDEWHYRLQKLEDEQ